VKGVHLTRISGAVNCRMFFVGSLKLLAFKSGPSIMKALIFRGLSPLFVGLLHDTGARNWPTWSFSNLYR